MTTPRISVIIPAYNRESTIQRAIESVRAQDFANLEILVVDDASTDSTREIVAAIDEPRLQLVARPQNGGASAARNSGIRAAKGELIAFLDSDDEWMPRKLGLQLGALETAPASGSVSCTGFIIHLLDHGTMRAQWLDPTPDWHRRLAMDCNLGPGTTQLATRQIFEKIGLMDETLPRFEDWDWLLRYTRQHSIVPVSEPLAHVYNRRARLGRAVEISAELFAHKHADTFASLGPRDKRKALANLWLQVTGTYAFEGKLMDSIPATIKAARQRPLHTAGRLLSGAAMVIAGRIRSTK